MKKLPAVTAKRKTEKLTIEMEYTTPEARDAILALLGGISYNSAIGASRLYGVVEEQKWPEDDGFKAVYVDGDGADQVWFTVDGKKLDRVKLKG
jgi:hypothetical protein